MHGDCRRADDVYFLEDEKMKIGILDLVPFLCRLICFIIVTYIGISAIGILYALLMMANGVLFVITLSAIYSIRTKIKTLERDNQ